MFIRYIYVSTFFVMYCVYHVLWQNICIKNQDIYLFKNYTSVSSKPSKAQ